MTGVRTTLIRVSTLPSGPTARPACDTTATGHDMPGQSMSCRGKACPAGAATGSESHWTVDMTGLLTGDHGWRISQQPCCCQSVVTRPRSRVRGHGGHGGHPRSALDGRCLTDCRHIAAELEIEVCFRRPLRRRHRRQFVQR